MSHIKRGFVYHEMLEELGIETELPTAVLMELIAKELKVTVQKMKEDLREVDSPFVCGSSVILGYIDGKPQKRTTVKFRADTIFGKIKKKMYGDGESDINDMPLFLSILKDHLIDGFISRSKAS